MEGKQGMTKKLDEVAKLWNKTKNPVYKDLWYKFVKEFGDGRAGTLDDDICDELGRINNKNSDGVQSSGDYT